MDFKRCRNGIEHDIYETICPFLNRVSDDIFMGVLNDGTVVGVPEKAVPDMISNFISIISNPTNFTLTVYLEPEWTRCEGHTVIHVPSKCGSTQLYEDNLRLRRGLGGCSFSVSDVPYLPMVRKQFLNIPPV